MSSVVAAKKLKTEERGWSAQVYDFVTQNQSSVTKTASHQMAINESPLALPGPEDHTNCLQSNQTNSNESYYCHVPLDLRRKIWGNEYINLWEVLVEYRLSAEEVVVNKESGQAKLEKKAIDIDSLSKWIKAFGIYAAVYTIGRPHLAPHLFQYLTSIYKYAETRPWETVYQYDKDCRSEIARDSSKTWTDFDILLWSHKRDAVNPPQPKPNNSPQTTTTNDSPPDDDDREICNNYNYRHCRYGNNCFRQHRCLDCKKFGHPLKFCRI